MRTPDPTLDPRAHAVLRLLRRSGPLSRQELHRELSLRPNTVSDLAEELIAQRLVREHTPAPAPGKWPPHAAAEPSPRGEAAGSAPGNAPARGRGPGRPRVPLEVDPESRCVVGLSLEAGHVSAARLNLLGQPMGASIRRRVSGAEVVKEGARLLKEVLGGVVRREQGTGNREQCAWGGGVLPVPIAVGLSATGFIDRDRRSLLLSSATRGAGPVKLDRLYAAAGALPVYLDNDLQAMAIRWMMGHEADAAEDILLVSLRDGAIGAAVLVNGRPIRGSVVGGNELGHTRLPLETRKCLCGHVGCLERVFSSDYLKMHGKAGQATRLVEALAGYADASGLTREVVGYLAMAIGNAVNLLRPTRLVIASDLVRHEAFIDDLLRRVRHAMLGTLRDHTRVDLWEQPATAFAESAGWLALALVYHPQVAEGWRVEG